MHIESVIIQLLGIQYVVFCEEQISPRSSDIYRIHGSSHIETVFTHE